MSIKNLTKEDIDTLSYEELAYLIIQDKHSKMKIIDIFKKICELKNMNEKEFEDKIADFYDLISTNKEFLVLEKGYCDLRKNHKDCGLLIFDRNKQDVHCGGSGCGCSASVLCSHILNNMNNGKYNRILFCATGALLSPTSVMQGENIPCIAHLVEIRAPKIDK